MSNRVSRRNCEQVTVEQVYRVLRAGALTTKQVCQRLGMSGNGAEKLLKSLPGVHHGKIGSAQKRNLWSLE